MKYIKQFAIIIIISFIGEILHTLIPLPIPASIYGIVILFLCLELKVIKLEHVRETGKFLVEIMPIMFVPAGVGLMDSWGIIKESWLSYLIITFASTFIVMIVAGWATQLVVLVSKKKEEQKNA